LPRLRRLIRRGKVDLGGSRRVSVAGESWPI